jgi:hypothetical protein
MERLITLLAVVGLAGCGAPQSGYNYPKYASELEVRSSQPAEGIARCVAARWRGLSTPLNFPVTIQMTPNRYSILVTGTNARGESARAALAEITKTVTGSRISYYGEKTIIDNAKYAEAMAPCI